MGIQRCISCGSRQILALTEGNMLTLRVLIAFSKAEIDDVHVVLCGFVGPDQEVIGLDITVDNPLLMNLLDALNLTV